MFFFIFCFLGVNRKVFAYHEQHGNDYIYYFDENRSISVRELSDEFTDVKTAEFVVLGEKESSVLFISDNYVGISFFDEVGGLKSPKMIALGGVDKKEIRFSYIFDKELVVTKPFIEDWELSKDSQTMFLKTPLISDFKKKLGSCRSFKVKLEYEHSSSVVARFNLEGFGDLYNNFINSKQTLEEFVITKVEKEKLDLEIEKDRLALEKRSAELLGKEKKQEEKPINRTKGKF